MISFVFRTFTIFLLLSGMMFSFIFLFFGEPNEDNWSILWEQQYEQLPLFVIVILLLLFVAFIISIWVSIAAKTRENTATRYVKKLVEPDFSLKKKHVPHALKKALLQTNNLIETQRKSLQRLSNEKAEASDKIIQERIVAERQRLARELHDSVSQQLFAASMLLSSVTEQENEQDRSKNTLMQVEKIVQQAQLEMRALLLHLRPIALRNNTLAQGLRELILELQQKVYFNIDYQIEEIELSKAEEDHLFRIAQEALSNTLRHAKASEVELLLINRNNFAILRVQDNGKGFKIEDDKSTSYGLKNIAERAVEIGCTYKIVSVPGEGTIVEVKVPLTNNSNSTDMKNEQLKESVEGTKLELNRTNSNEESH
ncbi:sensor histidine kinase [Lysinibacillus telephonicus]|uniref:sensor histidine kinase n=1 Tax=Lysinibacillus telephonicus TaxID=1714840 RepID=UPI003B9F573E